MSDAPGPSGSAFPGPPLPDYPVALDFRHQAEYMRLLPLVKWLLAIPHYVVLWVLAIAGFLAAVAAFFAVLFTRRYPRALFDFLVGWQRWSFRVGAYLLLMTDRYPAFALRALPDDPVDLEIAYPDQGVDRWRPLVHWLLGIPYAIVAAVLGYVALAMAFVAFFTILFVKRFPVDLFEIAVVCLRWQARSTAYQLWMTTRYPPFVWA